MFRPSFKISRRSPRNPVRSKSYGVFVACSSCAFHYRRPGTGKEKFLSLGPYPDITLADARRSATAARNLVREPPRETGGGSQMVALVTNMRLCQGMNGIIASSHNS
ncbi:Arm DNA-binding domain-containing protein [Paraburkholderia sp. BL23I1N1]|uniref:Arm DNA-binding domain-containing protein n=1 Tax=Paraburkholderia sp. BL23I1N1 TaxID=1938802 RepID=UPI0038F60CC8